MTPISPRRRKRRPLLRDPAARAFTYTCCMIAPVPSLGPFEAIYVAYKECNRGIAAAATGDELELGSAETC
jgi:hypothetical protein